MVEWFKALVLKTSEVQASVGSNPTLSAPPSPPRFYRAFSGAFFIMGALCFILNTAKKN